MSSVKDKLLSIKASLPEGVTLVAVSKFHPAEAIAAAYEAGQRDFGESRAQELSVKAPSLPNDIRWHFIGHLQTNKVRPVVAHSTLIQSVDSLKLLREIDKEARKAGRVIDVLMEVHVAAEETKTGFTPEELISLLTPELLETLTSVRITGIMGMASNVDDDDVIAADFDAIKATFETLKNGVMASRPEFATVSMGMSHDHDIAIAHGSNMVRIGTDIFGEREY